MEEFQWEISLKLCEDSLLKSLNVNYTNACTQAHTLSHYQIHEKKI